ncbi:MAG: class I SAM-dependent methyltransferase, partial [Anaerolineae bacterium]
MSIEQSYLALSRFFDAWVRIMEMRTRRMEVEDAGLGNLRTLIISPPTDAGIGVLARANAGGETHVLCFSEALEKIARQYATRRHIAGLKTCRAGFFGIPFEAGYFDAVFANCFFDFCPDNVFDEIIGETRRVLKEDGALFAVYMDFPADSIGQTWVALCRRFPSISQGCRPVDIRPA